MTYNNLTRDLQKLKRTKIKSQVDSKIKEFKKLGTKSNNELFKELCFCILTANYSAEPAIKIQTEIKDGFITLTKPQLVKKLKSLGHRFPNKRAEHIAEARKHKSSLRKIMFSSQNEFELREWVVKNIKGLGFKEASHFLRNIGYENLAIVDFHIIDLLVKYKIIQKSKTLTPKVYIEIEKTLAKIAQKSNLTQAELDLYLWYMETGKILK
ncbi:MAG: N-glycosylase/DNA lyase [Candidatus Diapherotrites archaeon]